MQYTYIVQASLEPTKWKIAKTNNPERRYSPKELLQNAKKIKNDEFYTRIEDVEKELEMYDKKIWKNKVVFCNCCDAVAEESKYSSAFSLFFIQNFQTLGLKKLICTHHSGKTDLLDQGSKGYIFTKDRFSEFKEYPDGYDGSFDHPLSLKILNEEADIVCTNPPFSRAIEYWDMIIKSRKKFLIISNITNAINTAFIHYFRANKVWAGYHGVDHYLNPKQQPVEAAGHWYTNIPIKDRPKAKHLKIMSLKQIPDKHKRFDDAQTLLVDHCHVPSDYKKPFAVSARSILNGLLEFSYEIVQDKKYVPYIDGKEKFARVLVQKK